MSHVVAIKTEIRDPAALAAACRRLGLPEAFDGTAELYGGEASGQIVHLPDWRYPVVIDTSTGKVRYDNFSQAWGRQSELDRLLQAYAVEKARIEARKAGHTVTEQAMADGAIKLTFHVGGVA